MRIIATWFPTIEVFDGVSLWHISVVLHQFTLILIKKIFNNGLWLKIGDLVNKNTAKIK